MLGVLKILVLVLFCVGCVCANTYSVRIDTEHHVNVIDSRFLSFTIDPKYLFSNNENYKSKECMCMASSLSPAFLRIAGPSTSTLTFRNHSISLDPEDPEVGDLEESAQSVFHDVVRENLAGLIKKRFDRFKRQEQPTEVSQGQWKGFARWAKSSGFQLVFALNHDERTAAGLWDPNTAASILTMANRDNIDDIYWQLGYECKNQSIEEYLNDLETLRVITDTFPNPHKWKLVGGDVTGCLHHDSKSDFRDYVTLSCDMMDAVMLNGNSSTFELERMSERDRKKLLKVLSESTTPLWLSEKAWNEELGELSRAADWLTSLGHAAKNGFSAHFRELGATEMYQPTLSFYMALLFKNLVGDKVLDVSMEPEHAILFAHCTSLRRRAVPGAVTLFGVNLDGEPARMAVNMGRNDGGDVLQFVIGLDDTGNIVVNDRPMYFEGDIKPVVKRVRPFKTLLINLPPKSFGFWVLANTKVKACYSTDQDHNDVESNGTENVVKERNVSNDNESIVETDNSRNSPISFDDDKQIKDKLFKKHKKYYKHIESSGIDTVHNKVKKRSIDFDDDDVTTESIDFQDENDILNISSKLLQNRIDNLNEDLINMYDTFKDKNTRAKRDIDPTEQRKMRLEKLIHKMLSRKPKVKIARLVTRKNATIPFRRNIFRTKLLRRVNKPQLMIKQKYIRKINDQEKKNADIVKVRNRRALIKRTSEHQAQLIQEENPDKNLKSYWGLPEKFKLNKALVLLPQDDEDDTPFKERSEEIAEDNEEKIETFQKQIKVQTGDSISVNEGYPIEKVLKLDEYKIPEANKTGPDLFLPAGRDIIGSSEDDDAKIVPIKDNISKKPEFEKVMELNTPTIEYYDAGKMRLIQNNFNKIKVSHESNELSEIYTPIASTRPIIEFYTPEDKPHTLPVKFVQKNIFENVPGKEHEKHKPKISNIQHTPTEHYVPLYKPDLELYEPGEKKLNLDIPKETTTETNYNVVQTTNKVRTTNNKVQTSDQEEPKDKAFELFQTLRRLYKTGGQDQNDNQLEEKILKILKKKEKLLDVYKPTHEQHSSTKHPAEYRPAQNKVVDTERYVPMIMDDRLDVNEFKQHKMMGDRLDVNEFKQHKMMGDRLDVNEFKQHKMMDDRLDVNEFKQHKMMGDKLDVNEFKQHKMMDDRLDVNEFKQHKMMGDRLDVNEFKQHKMMDDRLDVNEFKQHKMMGDRLDVNEFKQHKMMDDRLDVNEFKQHKMMGDRLDVNEFKQHKMMGDRLDVNKFKQHKMMDDRLDVNEFKEHKMMGDRLDANELKQHKMMGDRLDVNKFKQHKMLGDRLDVNEFKQHKFDKINSPGLKNIERIANLRTEDIPELECQESLTPVYSHGLDKKPSIATVDIFKSAFKAMVDTILDINSNVKIVWKSLNLMSM